MPTTSPWSVTLPHGIPLTGSLLVPTVIADPPSDWLKDEPSRGRAKVLIQVLGVGWEMQAAANLREAGEDLEGGRSQGTSRSGQIASTG